MSVKGKRAWTFKEVRVLIKERFNEQVNMIIYNFHCMNFIAIAPCKCC